MPSPEPSIVVNVEPSWAQVIVPALMGVGALILAAVLGAVLGARWTRKQALQLHRIQRQQDALLVFLDLLSDVDLAMRRSLPGPLDPMIHWSEAVPGVGAKMIREHRGVTWDRSDEPDNELFQWGSVVAAILDTEAEWRGHLRARVNRTDVEERWWRILEVGARMGLKGTGARGQDLERLHGEVMELMDEVRNLA